MRIVESLKLTKSTEVDVIGRIDGLRNAIDRMCNRKASAQGRTIFHVIDTKMNFINMK